MKRRSVVLGTLIVVGVLASILAAAQQRREGAGPSAAGLQVEEVSDNLYVLRGGGGNTAVFITSSGVVLVDTKTAGWGQPIIDRVRELTDKPVTTIINTHTHYDHVEGNVEFPPNVEVVAHENTAKLMPEMRDVTGVQRSWDNVFREHNGRNLPDRTFRDRMTLGTGNDRVELYYFGRAHTGGDAFVVFPVARTLHTGDAFPNKALPILDANNGGSGVEFPETIATLAQLPGIDKVIAGHNATLLTMADVKVYSDLNREFLEAVRAGRKAGRTVTEIANTWKMPERLLKAGYRQSTPERLLSNVQVVWDELN